MAQSSKTNINIKRAEKILNEDHYGLEKVKERILENLAVMHLTKEIKGPILCLVGPAGSRKDFNCQIHCKGYQQRICKNVSGWSKR